MAASALENALAQAVAHHDAGRLADAAAVYRRVLQQDPGNAQALHYLGVMAHQVGRHDVAAQLLERSVRADPHNAGFRFNLGNLYFKQQRFTEAVAAYRESLRLDPLHPQAQAHLTTALARGGGRALPEPPPSPVVRDDPVAAAEPRGKAPLEPPPASLLPSSSSFADDAAPESVPPPQAVAAGPLPAGEVAGAEPDQPLAIEAVVVEGGPVNLIVPPEAPEVETLAVRSTEPQPIELVAEDAIDAAPATDAAGPFVQHLDVAPPVVEESADDPVELAAPESVAPPAVEVAYVDVASTPRAEPDFPNMHEEPAVAFAEEPVAWTASDALAELDPAHVEPDPPSRGGRAAPPLRGLRQAVGEEGREEQPEGSAQGRRTLLLGTGFDRPFDPVDDTQSEFYVLHAADVPMRADADEDPVAGADVIRGLNLQGALPPSPRKLRKLRGSRRTSEVLELRRRADELVRQRRPGEAIELLQGVVALRPDSAKAHRDLGVAYLHNDMLGEAVASLSRALALRPLFAEAHASLGDAYHLRGQVDRAIECYQRVLSIKPSAAKVHSNLLLTLNYTHRYEPRQVFQEHLRWAELHALPLSSRREPHANDRSGDRVLRIGYVSPDFRQHSVNHFVEPILAHHDHGRFSVTCYSDVHRPDGVTEQLNRHCDFWRDVRGMGDEEVASLVRADRIDILVDLSGHTGTNRMGVFARKPAPVQVTYLGYPNTTGMAAVDWRITDACADPPGMTEHLYAERLVRLPRTFLCYRPPPECPELGPAPCADGPRAGQVTFGCFNILAKVTPEVMALWARILAAVPNSRLVMKGRVGALKYDDRRQCVLDIFNYHGIHADRLDLLDKEPDFASHLQMYRRIDVVLDPFPYNGTTTTCEALWMGVPVITLAGASHVARVGVSLLSGVGLPELIAQSPADYVRKAVALANDPKALSAFRRVQRQRMRESALMDAERFTRTLEAAYTQMWERWCAAPPPLPEAPVPVASTLTLKEE